MQPSEFWGLHVYDWWAEFDAKIKEARAMDERLDEVRGAKVSGAFSKAEWADARRRHAERKRK
jgi:hypothetical protein